MIYAIKEYARTAVDILARRTRLSFLNVLAADEALPRVIQIMAKELKWDEKKIKVCVETHQNFSFLFSFFLPHLQEETDRAKTFLLREMGLNLKRDMRRNVPINFTREEMSYYMKYFRQIDVENKGFLTLSDLKRHLQVSFFLFDRVKNQRFSFVILIDQFRLFFSRSYSFFSKLIVRVE